MTLLTTEEAAEMLNVKPRTLEIWRQKGGTTKLPFIRLGRVVRYRLEDLEEFLKGRVKA